MSSPWVDTIFYSCISGTCVAGLPRRLALVSVHGAFSVSDLTLPTVKGRRAGLNYVGV